jgi:hypothetical protein
VVILFLLRLLYSLGGFVLAGKTGIGALLSHTPTVNNIGRFVFYAMPHIAISQQGEIGSVYREGVGQVSHACGSLSLVVKELDSGHINFQTDPDDLEQCTIRQKILSAIHYGEPLDQVRSLVRLSNVFSILLILPFTIMQFLPAF